MFGPSAWALLRVHPGWWLGLGVACALTGCASAGPRERSRAAIEAAGEDTVANLEAGRYRKACEDFTVAARMRLTVFPSGGCPGALAFARGFLAVDGRTRLGQRFDAQVRAMLPRMTVEGDEARVGGVVEARYEQGRWRFEARREVGGANEKGLRADLEAMLARLRQDHTGQLLGQAETP